MNEALPQNVSGILETKIYFSILIIIYHLPPTRGTRNNYWRIHYSNHQEISRATSRNFGIWNLEPPKKNNEKTPNLRRLRLDVSGFTTKSPNRNHVRLNRSASNLAPMQHAAGLQLQSWIDLCHSEWAMTKKHGRILSNIYWLFNNVDGRNPAPVDWWFIGLSKRNFTSQVVHDFFHQQ